MYDHGARNRNPISTLWYGIDPLFEKYPDYSPYNYCTGNPVKLVDPDGRFALPVVFALLESPEIITAATAIAAYYWWYFTSGKKTTDRYYQSSSKSSANEKESNSSTKSGSESEKKHGGEKDTNSSTRKESLNKAKDQNKIPRSKSPDKEIKPGTEEGDKIGLRKGENARQYEYTNSEGEKISIREDLPKKYGEGGKGDLGPHFNAVKSGGKLKQHHNY